MALYLAIVLLAESIPLQAYLPSADEVAGTYAGTALGLAIAHVYAFGISTRLVTHRGLTAEAWWNAGAQILAAAAVAVVAIVPFLVFSGDVDLAFTVSGCALAALIAVAGYGSSRGAGGSIRHSLMIAAVTLGAAALVVVIKATLAH